MSINSDLAKRLSLLLREKNWPQHMLAAVAGVTNVSVSRYVSGDSTPGAVVLARMAKALGVTTDYLLGLSAVRTGAPEWKLYPEEKPAKQGQYLIKYRSSPGAEITTVDKFYPEQGVWLLYHGQVEKWCNIPEDTGENKEDK